MSTTGLVLKPISPSEAARSRSLSGAARSREQNSPDSIQKSRFKEATFVTEFIREQGEKEKLQSPFDHASQGRATPGSGMLSSDVMFVLQENSPKNKEDNTAVPVQATSNSEATFNPAAPSALSAYGRARESVDRVRTAYAAHTASKEAEQSAAVEKKASLLSTLTDNFQTKQISSASA